MTEAARRPRIAALVATPSKDNTGMRVVNDALVCWLDSLGLLTHTDFFQFETPAAAEAVSHRCILELAPRSYDRIVVWGDFLVDRNWLTKACERVARERDVPATEVLRHAERVIFGAGEGAHEPARIVAGQCFLVSDDCYDLDHSYQGRFAQLAREARVFQMRDPLSAARAGLFAGAPTSPVPPLDAALLRPALRARSHAAPDLEASRTCDGFGLFFGRTQGGFRAKLACALAAARARSAGRPRYLRWLPAREAPSWVRIALRPSLEDLPRGVDEVVALLRTLSFVVTDTYHLALVCWSAGVPAICVGAGAQRFEHSVHDKKKEIFFLSQRIERFHVFAEEGFAAAHRQARAMLEEIATADPGPAVARRIGEQAQRVLRALDDAIG